MAVFSSKENVQDELQQDYNDQSERSKQNKIHFVNINNRKLNIHACCKNNDITYVNLGKSRRLKAQRVPKGPCVCQIKDCRGKVTKLKIFYENYIIDEVKSSNVENYYLVPSVKERVQIYENNANHK
ncbi:hypothetical protein EDEG_01085 [Edhazardia aedis USNM 41457]|uniref:Uncharacterized protein n=1 Tax=Edhazardia aedis (strain USNM 41457) TaxID=1003232 RepID=J9DTU6_EDHAE|nr:hypothetical protein EDEG_01085 [Edhazardia aedis USNM 41457]|eukprot:EJW04722.1 hypothetical protein EDEG_01085 [Edhazardia aedis USNM 41457]